LTFPPAAEMLAINHPEIFEIIADIAHPRVELQHVSDPCYGNLTGAMDFCTCDKNVCYCSRGQLKFPVGRCLQNKIAMCDHMQAYEHSYWNDIDHQQTYLPAHNVFGVYHSPVLMLSMALLLGDDDHKFLGTGKSSETYKHIYAYTVYAYQYDLWVWPCMSITRVPRNLFVDWLGDVQKVMQDITLHSDYSNEYCVAAFLHQWYHGQHIVCSKPVIADFRMQCRHRHLQLLSGC